MKLISKIFAFLIVFMFVGTSYFYYDNYVKENGIVKVSENKSIKSNSAISMMYETDAGSGEYIEATDSEWPSDGYTFNSTLSKCENGSNILWDDTNKQLIVNTNKSDKCYVYFDVYIADASVDWEYELDDATNTIILTNYIGQSTDVIVYSTYIVNDVIYKNVVLGSGGGYSAGPFYNQRTIVTSIVVEDGVKAPNDARYMFYGCDRLTSLDVTGLDTSNVTEMYDMFNGCSNLISLDVSNFDTSNVTDMGYMFNDCSNLISLDVSNFDTSNVTDMSNMFNGCSNLISLDVSNFDTSNVTYMGNMFNGCSNLTSLDVSDWNTSNLKSVYSMFEGCSGLTTLDVSGWDMNNVAGNGMNNVFRGCSALSSITLGPKLMEITCSTPEYNPYEGMTYFYPFTGWTANQTIYVMGKDSEADFTRVTSGWSDGATVVYLGK